MLEDVIDKDLETKENFVVSPRKDDVVVPQTTGGVKREEFVPQVSSRTFVTDYSSF